MSQPPETRERFRIICEADSDQVGGVIADLTRRGITSIGHELITDVATFRERPPRRKNAKAAEAKKKAKGGPAKSARGQGKRMDPPNYEFVRSWIGAKKKFAIEALRQHFVASKRTVKSASPILTRLTKERVLKKLGNGWYEVRTSAAKKTSNGAEQANG